MIGLCVFVFMMTCSKCKLLMCQPFDIRTTYGSLFVFAPLRLHTN